MHLGSSFGGLRWRHSFRSPWTNSSRRPGAVRTRLDLSRPVEREVVLECLAIAQQAPSASNMQNWHFMVVTDAGKRAALAELYRKGWEHYLTMPIAAPNLHFTNPAHTAMQARIMASLPSFIEHFHEIPVYVIPCLSGRCEGQPALIQSAMWGTIAPAAWSFMLAARAWARDGLDIPASPVRRRGRPRARHRVCGSYASMPDPGGVHAGHAFQAGMAGTFGHHCPLGDMVSREADGRGTGIGGRMLGAS
jgi:nitroreductase